MLARRHTSSKVQCFDYDFASRDELLGAGHASLTALMENGATAHAVAVDLSSQGVVNLVMAWQAEGSLVPSLDAADALLQV